MRWYYIDVNPEPWAIGDAYVARSNGKLVARVGRNNQLAQFKEAVREELESLKPELVRGWVRVVIYLWRQNASYTSTTGRGAHRHRPDATNMQKAIEDACQGILFENDRMVNDIHTVIVRAAENVEGHILIGVDESEHIPSAWLDIPDDAVAEMSRGMERRDARKAASSQEWGSDNDSPF